MKVEIFSDVACPWCYIGKRRFETALGQFEQSGQIEINWRSYQLDPAAHQGDQVGPVPDPGHGPDHPATPDDRRARVLCARVRGEPGVAALSLEPALLTRLSPLRRPSATCTGSRC